MTLLHRKGVMAGLVLTLGLALLLWLTADLRLRHRVEATERLIQAELPIGTHSDSVLALLDSKGIEHSEYLPKHRNINAAIRNVVLKWPVSYGIFVRFDFDEGRRLASYRVDVAGDGP